MKKLITLVTLMTITHSFAACELTMDKKKAKAKTAYVNGVSVSAKIRTALESQCTIKYNVLTEAQVKEMNIKNLEKRLAKLKGE